MNDTVLYDAAGLDALRDSGGWAAALAALALLAVVAAGVCGWRERRVAPRGWVVLTLLRVVAIGATALLVAGVERRALTQHEEPSRAILLVDRSASMQLPAAGESPANTSRADAVTPAVTQLAERLARDHTVRTAGFDLAAAYDADAAEPGAATRLGAAVRRVLDDHAATPLAGVVLVSDGGWNAGPDPAEAASLAAARGVPIHTVGVGPLTRPANVGLRDLAAPSRASVGDPFRATVALSSSSDTPGAQRVTLTLRRLAEDDEPGPAVLERQLVVEPGDDGGLTGAIDDLRAADPGRYELAATLTPDGPDADPDDNRLTTVVELVDEPTRVLLAAGGPTRDYRFLRDQLFRDDEFTCDVLLQSAAGAVTQDAGDVRVALPTDAAEWEAYDTLVAIDLEWRDVSDAAVEALAEWVATRGGGVVFAAAGVQTPAVVRTGLATPLRKLLPVTLRDDPLAMSAGLAAPQDPMPVKPTPAGEAAEFLRPPRGADGEPLRWSDVEGFYREPLPGDTKPGAVVLAELGDAPLLVEQNYGAGRVVYLASAETWRLRRASPAWFTSLHAGLLRRVSQGRLLGGAAEGALLFDQRRYDLGDLMTLRYVARSPEGTAGDGALAARVAVGGDPPREVTLRAVDDQPGLFAASWRAESVGRHAASFVTPGGARLTAAAPVTLPSLESETLVQNAELLRGLADSTDGVYVDLSAADASAKLAAIAAATPSLAETTLELGPPDQRFARHLATAAMAVLVGALSIEWMLRRTWRLA